MSSPKPSYGHRWHWKKNLPNRHNQPCRIITHGRRNTILVQFDDDAQITTSRHALRRRAK